MNKATHAVGVRMEPELYERLTKWAEVDRRSISASVSIAIEEALARRETDGDRQRGILPPEFVQSNASQGPAESNASPHEEDRQIEPRP